MVSHVNHCDLRGPEGLAVIGPAERCCPAVVVVDEGDDLVGQVVERVEFTTAQQPTFEYREEELDLVEPAGMGGCVMDVDPGIGLRIR